MWQADGWGWRARVGVLTPHADVGPESEFHAMAPAGVSVHAARVRQSVVALRTLAVRRLALIDPPWFSAELNQMGARYFESEGFDVVYAAPAGLPSGQSLVHPGQLYEWARAHVPASAEAVFVGGNGFRAIGAIQALEEDLGRPVLTAHQVAFWLALRLSGTRSPVTGYGELFTREPAG